MSQELTPFQKDFLRWHKRLPILNDKAHWCYDWDLLPVDETCEEIECCHCFPAD